MLSFSRSWIISASTILAFLPAYFPVSFVSFPEMCTGDGASSPVCFPTS